MYAIRSYYEAWQRPFMPEFMSSMAVAGIDGTARRRLRDSPAKGTAHIVITSYSIHYTKLYDITGQGGRAEKIEAGIIVVDVEGHALELDRRRQGTRNAAGNTGQEYRSDGQSFESIHEISSVEHEPRYGRTRPDHGNGG